jgi:hypothetical protein
MSLDRRKLNLMPSCKLTVVDGDPDCRFRGATGDAVTLTITPIKGSVLFHDVSYAGKSILSAPASDVSFTVEGGSNDLSVLYTFSSPAGTAELHEKCPGNTLLDDAVTALNNAKIYHVCGSGAAPAANAAARKKVALPKKAARKKNTGRGSV